MFQILKRFSSVSSLSVFGESQHFLRLSAISENLSILERIAAFSKNPSIFKEFQHFQRISAFSKDLRVFVFFFDF